MGPFYCHNEYVPEIIMKIFGNLVQVQASKKFHNDRFSRWVG